MLLKRKHVSSVCPKTGKPIRHNRKYRWLTWAFPITGLLALTWFLVRVIPKPSRATYPCQRVAFPLASGFVVWILGALGSIAAFRKAKAAFARARYVVGIICIAMSVGFVWIAMSTAGGEKIILADPQPVNEPIGSAKGIHPGRVVWIHDANATDWEYTWQTPEHWYENEHTDQAVVNKMMSRAIRGLAGKTTDEAAWDEIFRHFNQSHGRGDVGYAPGEKIAIKINHTLSYGANPGTMNKDPGWGDFYNWVDNSPQLTIALLRQLIHKAGVDPCDITIGDPGRIMPNYWYDMVEPNCPNVVYMARVGGMGRTQSQWSSVQFHWSDPCSAHWVGVTEQDHIPVSFAEADYFINFPILKSHDDSGVTICGKNNYGSLIRNPDAGDMPTPENWYNMHHTRVTETPGMGNYRCIVDLLGHPELGGKTLLCLIDGLFAGEAWNAVPTEWNMQPFNGGWPSSIFVSQDPVAIDSVSFDFLWTEWDNYPRMSGADDYLHEAALANDPCSGTFYDPNDDGVGLTESLGVHEHWNNSTAKQYTRNLETGDGIELTAPMFADLNGDSKVDLDDLNALTDQWLQTSSGSQPPLSADIAPGPSGDGIVNMKDFALFARYWSP